MRCCLHDTADQRSITSVPRDCQNGSSTVNMFACCMLPQYVSQTSGVTMAGVHQIISCTVLTASLFPFCVDAFLFPPGPAFSHRSDHPRRTPLSSTARGQVEDRKVIVIGGSGRVGGSTVRALRQLAPNVELVVGGRSERNFVKSVQRWRTLPGSPADYDYSDIAFSALDLTDAASITNAIADCDLVVHTAGPFQRKSRPEVLEAAIRAKVSYVDVCDDARLAAVAKGLSAEAQAAGVPATISAGIWPGVDQLMAVEACELLGGAGEVESIDFSAFTAGTGNAGTTILSATFLILCEKVLGFKGGEKIYHEPASGFRKVDFGGSIGQKTVFRMNLIESFTCNQVLSIPNISTYFGTSPEPWNYLLKGMTLLPDSIMGNRDLMQALAEFSEPLVRITDKLVGATNAMRLEAVAKDGRKAVLKYAHEDLEVCVGIATAAFAVATLRGEVRPGVWYPEEAFEDATKRRRLFDDATRGAFMWEREMLK